MIFEKKRMRTEEPPPPPPEEEDEERHILRVILPDGSAKGVSVKRTTHGGTVLRALCAKFGWTPSDYDIDLPFEMVQLDHVYEISKKGA